MIVLDTTVLVYAVGVDHELADPCRRIVSAVASGELDATTTVEVVQEFVHVRARRRRSRADAAKLGVDFSELLSPLVGVDEAVLRHGLRLFERHRELGSFDAVLAAAALEHGAEALVSANESFRAVPRLTYLHPGSVP